MEPGLLLRDASVEIVGEETYMSLRDFPKFTDAALLYFIHRFPSHPDHAAAVAELERRRRGRDQRAEPAIEEATPVGRRFSIWAILGIVIFVLVLLFLLADLVGYDSP